jgi:hypothetical protein
VAYQKGSPFTSIIEDDVNSLAGVELYIQSGLSRFEREKRAVDQTEPR